MTYIAILITFLAYLLPFEWLLIEFLIYTKLADSYSKAMNLWGVSPRFIYTYKFATIVCIIVSTLITTLVIWCCYVTHSYVMLHLHDSFPQTDNYIIRGLLVIGLVLLSIINTLALISNLIIRPRALINQFIRFNKSMKFMNYLNKHPNRFYITKILNKLKKAQSCVSTIYIIHLQKSGYILIPSFGIEFLITGKTIIIRNEESKEITTYEGYIQFIKNYKGTDE